MSSALTTLFQLQPLSTCEVRCMNSTQNTGFGNSKPRNGSRLSYAVSTHVEMLPKKIYENPI